MNNFKLLLLILIFASCANIKNDRNPQSYGNNHIYQNYVHFDLLKISDLKSPYDFVIANTNSFSELQIENTNKYIDLEINISCDQKFVQSNHRFSSDIEERDIYASAYYENTFTIEGARSLYLVFGPEVKKCSASISNRKIKDEVTSLNLTSETVEYPWLSNMAFREERCKDSEDYFLNQKYPQMNCPIEAPLFETLETPESGFVAKLESVLGYKLSNSFIKDQNPYAEIDFSKAPKLKSIFLATLVYRSDFYGTVMARALEHHLKQGTMIYLVTTKYMMFDKDKKLLEGLARKYKNFRLQEFEYTDPGSIFSKAMNLVNNKFRDMHIKLMITLSDTNEKDNTVVFGGRNIHDGFLFKEKPDYSKYPDLIQYGTEDSFVHWNDFEMKFTSSRVAKSTAAHLLRFLNRDTFTQKMEEIQFLGEDKGDVKMIDSDFNQELEGQRHFISLPYNDNLALEKIYISMIDNAKKTIKISSPYLRPSKKILEALERAAARNIDITIQTRIELIGDTQAWLYEEVNKESINKLFSKVKLYQWKENSILHSKFLMVDGELGFIGSVNLSRRSFVQDVENGFLIKNKKIISKMESIFNGYIEKSTRISEEQKRKFLPSIVIQLLENQF